MGVGRGIGGGERKGCVWCGGVGRGGAREGFSGFSGREMCFVMVSDD